MIAQEESSGGVDRFTDGASDRNGRIADSSHNGDRDSSLAYPGSASAVEQWDGGEGLRMDTWKGENLALLNVLEQRWWEYAHLVEKYHWRQGAVLRRTPSSKHHMTARSMTTLIA